jgi:hypothetical protein
VAGKVANGTENVATLLHIATRSESHPAYHLKLMGSPLYLPFTQGKGPHSWSLQLCLEEDGVDRAYSKQDVYIQLFNNLFPFVDAKKMHMSWKNKR